MGQQAPDHPRRSHLAGHDAFSLQGKCHANGYFEEEAPPLPEEVLGKIAFRRSGGLRCEVYVLCGVNRRVQKYRTS